MTGGESISRSVNHGRCIGIVGSTLASDERRTGQFVQRAHERSQQPLDMTTHVQLRHRPVLEHDAVLLARPATSTLRNCLIHTGSGYSPDSSPVGLTSARLSWAMLGDNYPDRSHWITGNVTHEFPLPHE
jgi:hypothetical protein